MSTVSSNHAQSSAVFSRQRLLGLPAATLAGLLLRVLLIGSKSIWLDEAFSRYVASLGPQGWMSGIEPNYPPLYAAFLAQWLRLGESEAVMRLSSALFGVLAIVVVYFLARDLAGKGVALAAAWLVALAPLLVWYSQELRGYSLLVFLVLLSSLAFVRLITRPRIAWWLIYALAVTAALYTHYYAVLLVPAQAGLLLALLAQRRVRCAGVVAVLAAWPVIVAVFWPWLSSPVATNFAGAATTSGGSPGALLQQTLGLTWSTTLALLAVAAAVALAAVLGGWALIRSRGLWPRIYASPALRAALFSAFVVVLVASVVPRGYIVKRVAVIAIPFLCLGIAWFWPLAGRLSKALAVLLALSAVAALVNVVAIPKDDWRATAQYLAGAYQAGDAIWIAPAYDDLPFEYYNRGQLPVTGIDDVAAAQDPWRGGVKRIWLVYNDNPTQLNDTGAGLEGAMAAKGRAALKWSAYRMRVVLFEPN